jgi:hypothetical protein
MYTLCAGETLIGDVHKAIEDAAINDVTLHPPFLGKTVIQCSTEHSASLLASRVEGLRIG